MTSETQTPQPNPPSSSPPPSSNAWKERILLPTVLAGLVGGGSGFLSSRRAAHSHLPLTYAANLAIVAGCYCGARELVRDARASEPDDLINSVVGGILSGSLLGRLQGGRFGAVRYSLIFAFAGTAMDFTTQKLKPFFQSFKSDLSTDHPQQKTSNGGWFKLPEWSPIQVLDEEALAAKRAREQQLYSKRVLGKLNNEES
ncbi:hypothetical protein QJS10_CPB04g01264 [Acorus calamus]|uniref:Mitochondrial inner membrane translocase subunit Tim17/Tim22/Tim23/peroxisomal protein PMP24 n=1 Tax=Acorus calamus TaxID=4465 RepID=A0AAV9EXS1_ACOCL|nr:hypothetical protein QJS10_CPB04g01264 [Acorus calamus]